MDLNLRKARKLEQKIQSHVDSMKLNSEVSVRALSDAISRKQTLDQARQEFLAEGQKQQDLIKARFEIRRLIGNANQTTGINDLMNQREMLQELLAKSSAKVSTVDLAQLEDEVILVQNQVSKGTERYGTKVSVNSAVSTDSDIQLFKKEESDVKNQLEDVEDQLSQKNLGVTITLSDDVTSLLQSNGLL